MKTTTNNAKAATTKIIVNPVGNSTLRKNSQRRAVLEAVVKVTEGDRRHRPLVEEVLATVKKSRAKSLRLTASQVRMALLGLHRYGWIRVVNGNSDAWVKYATC